MIVEYKQHGDDTNRVGYLDHTSRVTGSDKIELLHEEIGHVARAWIGYVEQHHEQESRQRRRS